MAKQDQNTQFKNTKVQKLREMYSDEMSRRRRQDTTPSYSAGTYTTAAEVRKALSDAVANRNTVVEASKKLYVTNPIYASIINYLTDMFMYRYKVIPHRSYSKSKAKARKQVNEEDFQLMYNLMLEVVEGLGIEAKFPTLLNTLFIQGAVYFTTISDEESMAIDTIVLPDKYCRKIGETQFGTAVIQFDFSYFNDLGMSSEDLKSFLKTWPKEYQSGYNKYLKDTTGMRWQTMDSHFTSGLMMNELGIPTYFYIYGAILDFEKYQDNELQRSDNALKYLVIQTVPVYQDKLVFEIEETAALHKSLRKIIETNDNVRLITTYGDAHVERVADNDTAENQVLNKAYQTIFSNAGFNSGLFSGDSVTALKMSLVRDKGMVWKYIQVLLNFYNITVNSWFDFKNYQADIDILPISSYTYTDDMETIKTHATLGVGKMDYFIASGIKQKNIQDTLSLESFLGLNEITPMQTSYTQSAEDRAKTDEGDNGDDSKSTTEQSDDNKTEIEPSDNKTEDNQE